MANSRNSGAKKNKRMLQSLAGVLCVLIVLIGAALLDGMKINEISQYLTGLFTGEKPSSQQSGGESALSSLPALQEGQLRVQYIDVGQGDCSLIELPNGQIMVIDAGNNPDGKLISSYLRQLEIEKIDYLVGTHPHEDHIGGLDVLIQDFAIGALYMPKVSEKQVPTTKTYEDVLNAAADKKLKIKTARAGVTILDDAGVKIELIAPNSGSYQELNSYSAVVKITFGEKRFLFMGDAEKDSEREILEKRFDVKADVLKLGHHGSSTSSSLDFLWAVAPQAAVISCGKNNDYGHPHTETIDALQQLKIGAYRTDEEGTIVVTCEGGNLSFERLTLSCDGNKSN